MLFDRLGMLVTVNVVAASDFVVAPHSTPGRPDCMLDIGLLFQCALQWLAQQ